MFRRISFIRDSRLSAKVAGAAVGAVMAGLMLADSQAQALSVNVNVGGMDYEVTTFVGRYNDNPGIFNQTDMPWWGNQLLAEQFAAAVGTRSSFGTPNNPSVGAGGPLFAFSLTNRGFVRSRLAAVEPEGLILTSVERRGTGPWTFSVLCTATSCSSAPAAPSSSVPGPLPVLGLAVAFGFSRQLRKRIKASASSPPSTSEA